MKLINLLILRITLFFTIVMLFWSAVYFFLQMKEIHDGNDEGLTNLKQEFIAKANATPGFVETLKEHAPLNLIIGEITQEEAESVIENFATTKIYFATELEKEEVRMLTTAFRCAQNGKYYRLQCFTSTVESDDLIKNMLYLLLGLWIALALTIVIVSKTVISRANKPFSQLLEKLKKFRLDDSRMFDLPSTQIQEYVQLNKSVKELLEKNIHVFTEQKQFIENTSHELQTPLAVVIAKKEALLEKHQNNKEYAEEIESLLRILNRMKRLNSNLLLLSKIKNKQFAEATTFNLRNVLDSVVVDFEDLVAYKQISIEKKSDASPITQMNEDLAYILCTNLMKNAIAYNEQNGKIIIRYTPAAITIANSGKGTVKDIFNRYKSAKSSGLGLSIVKSIAGLYQIEVDYCYEGEMHVFKLSIRK